MGDLHLPFGRQKPMDIFGGWENYTERIEKNWNSVVGEDDCVVIPGDISWAMSIEEALPDFEFISRRLRGRKIISKGNHDYWWTTLKKMNGFLQTNGFDNIRILHNNAFEECGIAICGTRGWINDDGEPQDELVLLERRAEWMLLSKPLCQQVLSLWYSYTIRRYTATSRTIIFLM